MKRAQSIGVNTVIIAAIALLVLAIVAFLVVGGGGDVRDGLNSCTVNGGQCLLPGDPQATGPILAEYTCDGGRTCYGLS